jgi:hypothetical protein
MSIAKIPIRATVLSALSVIPYIVILVAIFVLGSILRNRFGSNLRIKPDSVKLNFAIVTS